MKTKKYIYRGEIWWCDLPAPIGNRPVLILQANHLNQCRIETTIIAVISSDLNLLKANGNVFLNSEDYFLYKDSVVKVTQIITVDKDTLYDRQGKLSTELMKVVEIGVARTLLL